MNFRLLTRAEAATVPGMVSPMPESLFVMGAVDEWGVVCALGCFLAWHADPLWVRPDKRGTGKILKHLWEAASAEVVRRGGTRLEALMTETKPGQPVEGLVARLCERVGGREIKDRHFLVPLVEG